VSLAKRGNFPRLRTARIRLRRTSRAVAPTSRSNRWPPLPPRRPPEVGRSAGYRCAERPPFLRRTRLARCQLWTAAAGLYGAPSQPGATAPTNAPSPRCSCWKSRAEPCTEPVPAKKPSPPELRRAARTPRLTAAVPRSQLLLKVPNRWLCTRPRGPRRSACGCPRGDRRQSCPLRRLRGPYSDVTTRGGGRAPSRWRMPAGARAACTTAGWKS